MTSHAKLIGRLAAAVAVIGLAIPATASADNQVSLRLGNSTGPTHVQTLRDIMFADIVEKKTNGDVKIQVFSSDQLGKQLQQVEGTMSGSQDFWGGTAGFMGNYQDDWRVLSVYYLFNSRDHIVAFTKSDLFEEMNKRAVAKMGLRLLNLTSVRTPNTFISKKPMMTMQDIKGLKVRIPDVAGNARSLKALGATPTPINFADSYLAFSQGVVDAIPVSLDGIRSAKFTDIGKYVLITEHNWEPTGIYMNEKSYQKLSPAQQKIAFDAAIEASDFYWKKYMESEVGIRQLIKQRGGVLIETDPTPWREHIVNNLVPELDKEKFWTIPELYQKIQAFDPALKKT